MTTTERPAPAGSPGVLRTRLLPPRLPPNSVARPTLVTRVQRGFGGRVLALVAGAGYGKTTLLVQALETSPTPWVWLSCDARLRTPDMLLAHVAAGIAEAFPGVASALPPGGAPEDQIAALANELVATIPDDFVLALDDVHALEGPVADALALLAADLPPNVHLAMTGRRALGPAITRSAAGGVTQIGEEELAFSFDEAAALLEDAPGGLAEDEIGVIHDRTEGWVAGLLLATRSAGGGAGARVAGGAHFDYLAEEVLGGLPADTQRFLLDTSVLERFTPAHAAAVSGRADARDVIRGLIDSHLFIVQAEGGWHRYHHLFHAFLLRHLAEHEPESLPALHLKAGQAWQASGDHQEAVRHFLEAGAMEEAATALEPVAESMVPTPERQTLAAWLARIPEDVWRPRPRIALAGALLAYLAGDGRGAFEAWDDAIARLVAEGDLERAAGALYRSQQAMLTAGVPPAARVAMAEPYLDRLAAAGPVGAMAHDDRRGGPRRGGPAGAGGAPDGGGARVGRPPRAGAAGALRGDGARLLLRLSRRPHRRGARAHRRRLGAAGADRGGGLPDAPGVRPGLPRGDPGGRRPLARGAGGGADGGGAVRVGRDAVRARTPQPLVEVDIALRAGRLGGLGGARAGGAPGRRGGARDERRIPHHRGPRAPRGVDRRHGTALARIGAARDAMRAYGDSYEIPTVQCELVLAAVDVRHDELARDIAEEAVAIADRYRLDWFRARASLLSAFVHQGTALGDQRLADALALSAEHDLAVLWAPAGAAAGGGAAGAGDRRGPAGRRHGGGAGGRRGARGAARRGVGGRRTPGRAGPPGGRGGRGDGRGRRDDAPAAGRGRPRGGGGRRARPRGAGAAAAPADPHRDVRRPAGVPGRRAGAGHRVHAGEGAGPARRAGVRRGARGAPRPPAGAPVAGPPPERGARALDTTLHELRRTLEPAASPRSGGSLVVREGELYRLALGDRDSWDAGEFLELARGVAGATDDVALGRMLRAETLWRGDFLPDFPYEPWAEDLRRELEHERVALLERLAAALMDTGRPAAAIDRLRRLLDADPEREGWHRSLMRAYAQAGERPLALRQFHACRATLRGRLGIEPSAETRELYASLL